MKIRLIFLFLLIAVPVLSQQKLDKKQMPYFQTINSYIYQNDTTDLLSSLQKISSDFLTYAPFLNEKWVDKLTTKIVNEETKYRVHAHSIARQFYLNSKSQNKLFENTYLEYKDLASLGNDKNMLWILVDLGNVFFSERDYVRAEEFYSKAEKIALKHKENYALSVIFLNYALIDFEQNNFKEAIVGFHQTSAIRMKLENPKMASFSQVMEALSWTKLHQADSAEIALNTAKNTYYHLGKNDIQLNTIPYEIHLVQSQIHKERKQFDKALNEINLAIQLALKIKLQVDFFTAIYYKANIYLDANKVDLARNEYENLLIKTQKDSLLVELSYVYKQLSTIESKLNNHKKANEYLLKMLAIDDLIDQRNNSSELQFMRTLSATYESDLKLQQARQKIDQVEALKEKEKLQRNLAIFISSVFVISFAIILFLFLKVRKNQRALKELYDQLRESNDIISVKSGQLERSNQIKDKLFSIIAHDLRNPLNRMSVEIAIAKRMLEDKSLIQPVENTLRETISLFERLLQWSKMETNQHIYLPVAVDLNENINKVVSFYLPEIQLRNIEIINTNETYFVHVDPNFLQTLLRNIISNSISAVLKNGTVKIDIMNIDSQFVTLRFQDSGKGFPVEVIRYFNHREANLNEISTGLGLILCKELIKISGWKMYIENGGEFGGASIQLRLPLAETIESAQLTYEKLLADIQLSQPWKEKLWPIRSYKFYQVSQIRQFLKTVEIPLEKDVKLWRDAVEKSVHDGNAELFELLLDKLKS